MGFSRLPNQWVSGPLGSFFSILSFIPWSQHPPPSSYGHSVHLLHCTDIISSPSSYGHSILSFIAWTQHPPSLYGHCCCLLKQTQSVSSSKVSSFPEILPVLQARAAGTLNHSSSAFPQLHPQLCSTSWWNTLLPSLLWTPSAST